MNVLVYYDLIYNKEEKNWKLWKNTETETSIGTHMVFKGTKKECLEKKETLEVKDGIRNSKRNRKIKSKKRRIRCQQSIIEPKIKKSHKRKGRIKKATSGETSPNL